MKHLPYTEITVTAATDEVYMEPDSAAKPNQVEHQTRIWPKHI